MSFGQWFSEKMGWRRIPAAMPWSAGWSWMAEGFGQLRKNWWFYLKAALVLLALRQALDWDLGDGEAEGAQAGSQALIVLSYLTDGILFASVSLAAQALCYGKEKSLSLRAGWRMMGSNKRRAAFAGLWGLPSAAVGAAGLSLTGACAPAVGAMTGVPVLGSLAAVALAAGSLAACCLLLWGGIFAACKAGRDGDGFMAAGSWGMGCALRARKPLAVVFLAFLAMCSAAAAAAAKGLSMLPQQMWADNEAAGWIGWLIFPGLLAAAAFLMAIVEPARKAAFAAQNEEEKGASMEDPARYNSCAAARLLRICAAVLRIWVLGAGLAYPVFILAGSQGDWGDAGVKLALSALAFSLLWSYSKSLAESALAWETGGKFLARWRFAYMPFVLALAGLGGVMALEAILGSGF